MTICGVMSQYHSLSIKYVGCSRMSSKSFRVLVLVSGFQFSGASVWVQVWICVKHPHDKSQFSTVVLGAYSWNIDCHLCWEIFQWKGSLTIERCRKPKRQDERSRKASPRVVWAECPSCQHRRRRRETQLSGSFSFVNHSEG